MHTPIEVTKDALAKAKELGADCVVSRAWSRRELSAHAADPVGLAIDNTKVSVGGGSTIGLGKALALHSASEGPDRKIKQIVIPTTYAGSEATPIIGQTENDAAGNPLKTTQRTLDVLPESIIYDIDLTLSLPKSMTVTSGLNAIAHAVEALWAPSPNPIVSALALQGIEHIAKALPIVADDLGNKDARSDLLYGAYCCGSVLGAVGMSIHHKLVRPIPPLPRVGSSSLGSDVRLCNLGVALTKCHTLGGSFGMPHSETHTIVLSHATAYNAPFAEAAISQIHKALGLPQDTTAAQGLYDLAQRGGAKMGLKDLGFKESDLEKAADIAVKSP